MSESKRTRRVTGRHALVDGIPFTMPVAAKESPVLMAVFKCNVEKAKRFLPESEIHPLRLWDNSGLFVVTVIDYRNTNIGKYVEYSLAIACTHGWKPAPRLLPALLQKTFGTGQFVIDLPVSTDISVKGGKGIWGMPKHKASLDFKINDKRVSSQYDLDGKLCTYVEVEKPSKSWIPLSVPASNYCAFRGMLFKSDINFKAKASLCLGGKAKFIIGDHPRVQPLKDLEISEDPLATLFIPSMTGVLDDHIESWFLNFEHTPSDDGTGILNPLGQGMDSVVDLPVSEEWLPAPSAPVPGVNAPKEP